MSFSRARYVTVCQQMLATVTVLMLGVTAAGALTLDIVAPDASASPVPGAAHVASVDRADVATAPVRPQVQQVPLGRSGVRARVQGTPKTPSALTQTRTGAGTIGGLPIVLTSRAETVHGYATVGAVWAHGVRYAEDQIAFEVRTSTNGIWSAWQRLEYHADHAPSGDESTSATDRPGTDPCLIGHVDQAQLRVATADGTVPRGLEFSLIDPGATHLAPADAAIDTARIPASDETSRSAPIESTSDMPTETDAAQGDLALSAMKVAPKPQIFSRAQWGADEKLREKGLPDYGTIKTGFVHHTVNANDYTKKQVPAIIRSIYAYHVISRGWRDIGYNFLVDRFGRIWEGRYGGVDKPVTGAHTLGFNDVAFAMSAIGNFDIARPPQAVVDAFARLFAWKLSMYNISATATGLKIHGRTLQAINGHRDVGQTACPGKYLYARIPDIRAEAKRIQNAAQTYAPTQSPAGAIAQPSSIRAGGVRQLLGRHGAADVALLTANRYLATLPLGKILGFRGPVRSAGSWSGSVPVGDVTGDRFGDMLVKAPQRTGWQVHPGTRSGVVSSTPMRTKPVLSSAVSIIPVGDWNGDGRVDVLGLTKKRALYLFRGKGGGKFRAGKRIAKRWGYTRTVAGGDLDRNGRPELLVQTKDHRRFRVPFVSTTKPGSRTPLPVSKAYNAYFGGGDMTGDGIADVWVRARSSKLAYILPGNGHGGFGTRLGPFAGFGSMKLRGVVNMTAGGRVDIVGRGTSGRLMIRANNQRKNAGAVVVSTRRIAGDPDQVLAVGDWNHDGHGDVIVRRAKRDRLVLMAGTGRGQFAKGVTMSNGWASISNLSAVGDITGDGRPDLVGRNASGTLLAFPSNGVTGFTRPRRLPSSVRSFNVVGGPAWSPANAASSALTSSDGSFVPVAAGAGARTVASAGSIRHDWVIGAGDVNADGHPDLLVRSGSGALWLVPGKATGVGRALFLTGGVGSYLFGG